MKNLFNFFTTAIACIFALGMIACNNGTGGGFSAAPASITFDAEGVAAGGASVTVTGEDWSVESNTSWITVSPASGTDGGSFTVSVEANDGSSARNGSITVTSSTGAYSKTVNVTQLVGSVVLDENTAHLMINDEDRNTISLTATVLPAGANQDVSWSSSDDAIATVAGGLVTAVAPGTAIITATADESGLTAVCEVTVTLSGFIIAENNLNGRVDWDTALIACPAGWRLPNGEELLVMCEAYHNEGMVQVGDEWVTVDPNWPADSAYWSSDTAQGLFGETGATVNFNTQISATCTIAGAMMNAQLMYVRCIKDVE